MNVKVNHSDFYAVDYCVFKVPLFSKIVTKDGLEQRYTAASMGYDNLMAVLSTFDKRPNWFYRYSVYVDGKPFFKIDDARALSKFGYRKFLWWLIVYYKRS